MTELGQALDRTEAHIREAGYRGYDPYDALASPLFRLPLLRSAKLPRWGFQQVLKRLPFQTRPLLGIAKGYNPVTLALCAQALTLRDMADPTGDPRRDEVLRLVGELDRMRTPGYHGNCWGYDFHWQARYADYPPGHPTVVATGFITHALFMVWNHYRLPLARDLILGAVPFVLVDLNRTDHGDMFCWSYSPTDHQEVLNATMKGARLLAQGVALGGDPAWLKDASATIRYVVSRQAESGSWPYSVGDARSWADHFHTCYNLDCLDEYRKLSGDTSFDEALTRGLAYYEDNFFTPEGAPRYYDRKTYPLDATCCGQALLTLTRFGRRDQALRTTDWILSHMALPDGGFKYQIHPHRENRLPYMRWSVAWLFLGLSAVEQDVSGLSAGVVSA